jgi:cysteinyl-tRNA synthetase
MPIASPRCASTWTSLVATARFGPPAGALLLAVLLLFMAGSSSSALAQGGKGAGGQPRPETRPVPPPRVPTLAERRQERLAEVNSWGYQLRLIDPRQIEASRFDMVVVDHAISAFRRFVRQFTPEEVATMRNRPGGGARVVLSYLSIGEAERYRFYWDQAWYQPERKPAWLGDVNPQWDGNYAVQFWDPAWQGLIYGSAEAYLERVIGQGFDGVYLDRADIFLEWKDKMPAAEARMVDFIVALAAHARRIRPDFLIVMQNAEELVRHSALMASIDGIAKEDLLFGIDHGEGPNERGTVEWSINDLRTARRQGHRIFVVEYLNDPAKIAIARRRTAAEGFVLHVTSRDLGHLATDLPDPPPRSRP